jgi:hypothetical protein
MTKRTASRWEEVKKSIIKLSATRAVCVEPAQKAGLVGVSFQARSECGKYASTEGEFLTPEQAAALIFSLEMALERLALPVRAHYVALAA